MTSVLITRISGLLERQFNGLIDMSDWDSRPANDKRKAFLSRALAALCIKSIARVQPEIAGKAVTDGFGDNGIDALYFDQRADALIVVQSHWSTQGNNPINADDAAKLAQGALDLLSLRFERFNDKVKTKEPDVRAALYAERPLKIIIVTAHTATQQIAPHVKRKIDDLVNDLNNPLPTAEGMHFNQEGIYLLITSESKQPKIKLQISLTDWGMIDRPFLAYYGRLHVNEISQWWTDHGNSLFTDNLRFFYPNSDVNNALTRTLSTSPEYFWYFNNGITVICDTLTKSAVGSPGRQIGVFTCDGASIVNGAQTVGTIGHNWKIAIGSPIQEESGRDAWVQVRIISLEDCTPEFSRRITRAANLQNAVGNREFAAMDPVQHRLATEFALDKRKYAYKQGESDPNGNEGCDIAEATQALACSISISLAVQAKREIGALWADTERAPYTEIFNDRTTGEQVWRCVQIMRAVDQALQECRNSESPRADLVAVHLNRLILHLVFQNDEVRALRHDYSKEAVCLTKARDKTKEIFSEVATFVQTHHAEEYLASFSKNHSKCEDLVKNLRPSGNIGHTGELFK